ncbi:MAG: type II secretion system protein J [Porcipelethomonas sp.]
MKKNKLKGFTLLELIIVMAIFSGLMVGAMAILRPVQKLYNTTAEFEDINADLDNVRRYIEDNIKYADKVNVYTGYNSVSELISSPDAAQLPEVQLKPGTTDEYEKVSKPVDPLTFFKKYYYDNVINDNNKNIFIMEISNAPSATDALSNPSGSMGKVNIYKLDLSDSSYNLISEANEEYYKKYSYNFHLGKPDSASPGSYTGFDYNNAVMSIDVFKNDFSDSDNDGKYFTEMLRSDNTSHSDTTASFSFVNIAVSPEISVDTTLIGSIAEDDEIKNTDNKIVRKAMRYKFFDSGTPSDNIYFIYTTPEILF